MQQMAIPGKKWVSSIALAFGLMALISSCRKAVDYTADVKPIINKNCITCHGGVRQKAGFSLLFRDEALAKTKSGKAAIIPGDPDHSEMIRRITLVDPEERMPYKHDPLSPQDVDILRRWIKEGAPWGEHWSYVPVKQIPVPEPTTFFGLMKAKSDWARNPVDHFIEQKLGEQGLAPSDEADKQTLLRRVSLDIIGMPAPASLARQFLSDTSDRAYEVLVDSLLASPHYGEKWAALWMDLARYADTKGYEADRGRTIWRYRDWLIRAFNQDKPYDKFLTEQLAGDLMPNTTDDQLIATAFHRNTMTNDEGGTDNEEFRTSAVIDRVNTTWAAVMGTTFSCVQCHSHPYDPFKHDEYYKFMAFFNNTRDEDTGPDYPLLRHYKDTVELSAVVSWIREHGSEKKAKESYAFLKTWQPVYNSSKCDSFINGELSSTQMADLYNHGQCRLKDVELTNKDRLIFRYSGPVSGGIWKIHVDSPEGEVIATIPLAKTVSWLEMREAALKPVNGKHNLYFTYTNNNLKKPDDTGVIFEWFAFTESFPGIGHPEYGKMKDEYWKLLTSEVAGTPVMVENPGDMSRTSYVFERGNWMVKGKRVEPDVPNALNSFPKEAPRNRLGLAMWLTSRQNPLTARTMVNRFWEQLFGTGLAETLEDLGSQGASPTHVELLDWLSHHFMDEAGWSMKTLLRTLVTSATYRQDAKVSPEGLRKDPYNRFYARGPRVRLSAEQIRDQALCISGVMSNKMYGPSVFPFQPPNIWTTPYNDAKWTQSHGEDQYRRAVYTYWKRSASYPSMIAFDGVSREVCSSRRIRTNTPLQALATLNDSAYVDMARHFAYRMQKEAGAEVKKQIERGFELATLRNIDDRSLQALTNLYNTALRRFTEDTSKASGMMGDGETRTKPETAALTVVANAILNLDELVTKN